jgi:hypothetical protein
MSTPFVELSAALTGEARLDTKIAAELESRIGKHYKPELDELLASFLAIPSSVPPEERARQALADSELRHKLAREIIRVWYTGQFQTPANTQDPPGQPEHYSHGLLWKVIRAHAPGFPNAGYGSWAQPPA